MPLPPPVTTATLFAIRPRAELPAVGATLESVALASLVFDMSGLPRSDLCDTLPQPRRARAP